MQEPGATIPTADHQKLTPAIRHLSEAIVLFLVVASPWAFGSVHPFFRYCMTAGISAVLVLWAVELAFAPPRKTAIGWFQLPIVGLVVVVALQLVPMASMVSLISPKAVEIKDQLYPAEMETTADGSQMDVVPTFSARNTISFYPAETFYRLLWVIQLGLLFTRIQRLASIRSLQRLCYACLINGSLLSYFAIIQYLTTKDAQTIYWTFDSLGGPFGPFVNRNHFAFYMNMCFGLSIGLLGYRRNHTHKTLLNDSLSLWIMSVLAFMIGAIVLCGSRGGLFSLVVCFMAVTALIGSMNSSKLGWRWFGLGTTILIFAVVVQLWLGFDFAESHYAYHVDNRSAMWLPLLDLARDFPMFGVGYGSLAHLEPITRSPSSADYFLEYAHNDYLQLALETGMLGLACGCGLLYLLCRQVFVRLKQSRDNTFLYAGLLLTLGTTAIHSTVEFGLAIPAIAVLAAVVFGQIAGLKRHERPLPAWLARLAAIALVLFAAYVGWDAKLRDLAERTRIEAKRLNDDPTETLRLMRAAVDFSPNDVELLVDAGRTALIANAENPGDSQILALAQRQLILARELCPALADAHSILANYVDTFQKSEPGLVHYNRARVTRPVDATLAFLTGRAGFQAGEIKTAETHFQDSLKLSLMHVPQILRLAATKLTPEEIDTRLLPADAFILAACADWYATTEDAPEVRIQSLRERALTTAPLDDPQTGEDFHLKGILQQSLGDLASAEQSLKSALRRDPGIMAWRLERAKMLRDLGRIDDAIDETKYVLQRPNKSSDEQMLAEQLGKELSTLRDLNRYSE